MYIFCDVKYNSIVICTFGMGCPLFIGMGELPGVGAAELRFWLGVISFSSTNGGHNLFILLIEGFIIVLKIRV